MIKRILLSEGAFKTYSAFLVNIAAAIFISIFVSKDVLDLTVRMTGSTIVLYFAITFERKA